MKIGEPEIRQEGAETTWRVAVETDGVERTLWFAVPSAHADLLTDTADAALVGLLLPAMARGERIAVEGPVSEALHDALARPFQALVRTVIPSLRAVEIDPASRRGARARPSGAATGFSAGIDSYAVLADHHYGDVAPGLRLTHLLFHNVGSHEPGGRPVFLERRERLRTVVERIGLPFVTVDSNLDAFYGPELHFLLTHPLRNTAVAHLLQGGLGRFDYASTYAYPKVFVGETFSLAFCDPIALPLLSTETLTVRSVGGEYTRVAKTLRVAALEDSHDTLDVCANPAAAAGRVNCSRCFKCVRTLLTLEIAGRLPLYEASFDLEAWREVRGRALREVLASRDPLNREIVRFARSHGYALPARARLAARLRRVGRRLAGGSR